MGQVSDKCSARWDRLSRKRRYALAQEVAERRSAELRRTYPGVVSLGVGFRVRGGARTNEIVLQVLVRKKWRGHRRGKGAVPANIRAVVKRGGRTRAIDIPTDVDVLGEGDVNAGSPRGLPTGLIARCQRFHPMPQDPRVTGSATAIVREAAGARRTFILGCNHVLTCSYLRNQYFGTWAPMAGARAHRPASSVTPLGQTVRWTTLAPGGTRFGMDAALALVNTPTALSANVQGVTPASVGSAGDLVEQVTLHTRRGRIRAWSGGLHYSVALPYGGTTIKFRRLYRLYPASQTIGGDSGAPAIRDNDTLVAMHIWGGTITIGAVRRWVSYAIPAEDLLQHGLFKDIGRLELAP